MYVAVLQDGPMLPHRDVDLQTLRCCNMLTKKAGQLVIGRGLQRLGLQTSQRGATREELVAAALEAWNTVPTMHILAYMQIHVCRRHLGGDATGPLF